MQQNKMSSNPNFFVNRTLPARERTVFAYEILEAMGKQSFIPVIAIPAILGLTQLGSSVFFAVPAGILLMIAGYQLLIGHEYVQLPNRFAYTKLRSTLAQHLTSKLLEMCARFDEASKPQLSWLASGAFAMLPYICLICVGIVLPVMALLGQSSFLTYIAILIYCVSLPTRDGRYILASASVLSISSIAPILQLAS